MTGGELTDEEWREFQSIPEQGYSHRGWVDRKIAARLAPVEVDLAHWKRVAGHVREQAEQQEARAAKTEALVEAGLGLADEWRVQREAYPVLVDYRASIAEVTVRLCEQELRDTLGGAAND